MSLTRSLLKELQISPDAAERIIAAHAESIDALRQERDAARGEAAQLESIRATRRAMPVTAPARNCRRWADSLIPIVSRWRRKSTSRRAMRIFALPCKAPGQILTRWTCCCLPSTPTKARLTVTKSPTRTRC